MAKCRLSKLSPKGERRSAICIRLKHSSVILWVYHNGHIGVILRCRANHRRTTDVDLLHRCITGCTGSNRLNKWVKVYNNQLEGFNVQGCKLLSVFIQPKIGQNAAVNLWVQGLDPAI